VTARRLDTRAHPGQRLGDPGHRPSGERFVALELELLPGLPGQDAGQQADERAGVAAVDRAVRRAQAPQTDARDPQDFRTLLLDVDSQRSNGADRRLGVLGAAEAANDGLAVADRPDQDGPVGDRLVTWHRHRAAQADRRRHERHRIAS